MNYHYEIQSRPAELGGGWRLRLLENGVEVGGGAFPADPNAEAQAGIEWFNNLSMQERTQWLDKANSALAIDAWAAYLRCEAHAEAEQEGQSWVASR